MPDTSDLVVIVSKQFKLGDTVVAVGDETEFYSQHTVTKEYGDRFVLERPYIHIGKAVYGTSDPKQGYTHDCNGKSVLRYVGFSTLEVYKSDERKWILVQREKMMGI